MRDRRYRLRQAREGDIGQLVSLLGVLFALEQDFTIDPEIQGRGLRMLMGLEGSVIQCVESGGRIVGMCSAQCLVSTAEGGLSALVEDLVVAEDHRGKGLGAMLLSSVEIWAESHGALRLQLLADQTNLEALGFYNRMGWRETRMVCRRKTMGGVERGLPA
ncbi:GNAT family N-acetyltransferase [Desulfoluna spongiiphila]|uniref:N-acetylglutamate synthase, GNAT family n=1 Tax=Desulfoluna spongiiphila TaxID=419481 RepID=A0A1G5HT15_9BACT|nr:GNAT family N-acetyltransferase [Desulfoluna spongiiphila]SCY66903.1 N-acetylglutamate synthase, GNAT family [Desulfoluna spongiiphila]VVS91843.1 acyl-coa n-acyltransferase [Desulfoluna spongiiphila]